MFILILFISLVILAIVLRLCGQKRIARILAITAAVLGLFVLAGANFGTSHGSGQHSVPTSGH